MPISPRIACTRMYNVCAEVTALWRELAELASGISDVPLHFSLHPFPEDIEDLWRRPDLGLAFICGRAFMLHGQKHIPIAVPLRLPEAAPLYHTRLLVREDSPLHSLENSLTSRFGWTVSHSHSGNAVVRKHLAAHMVAGREPLWLGPLHTPSNCLEALLRGDIDVAPLDAYTWELLAVHAPRALEGTRVLSETRSYPMPFLAASPGTDPDICRRLREAMTGLQARREARHLLEGLRLAGFVVPVAAEYAILTEADPT